MRTWSRITEITWVQWEFSWSIPDGRAKPEQFGILVTLIQNCSVQLGKVSVLTLFSNCFCKKKNKQPTTTQTKKPKGRLTEQQKNCPSPRRPFLCGVWGRTRFGWPVWQVWADLGTWKMCSLDPGLNSSKVFCGIYCRLDKSDFIKGVLLCVLNWLLGTQTQNQLFHGTS